MSAGYVLCRCGRIRQHPFGSRRSEDRFPEWSNGACVSNRNHAAASESRQSFGDQPGDRERGHTARTVTATVLRSAPSTTPSRANRIPSRATPWDEVEPALVHEPVVGRTEQHEVVERDLATLGPVPDVVAVQAPGGGAAGEAAAAVAVRECAADRWRDAAGAPSYAERLTAHPFPPSGSRASPAARRRRGCRARRPRSA